MDPVILRSSRLVLDPPTLEDVDTITAACQDPLFERYLTTPWPYRREHAEGFAGELVPSWWAEGSEFTWALRERPDGPLLGVIGLRAAHHDLGFWLAGEHRGNGYMAEATRAVAAWAFDELGYDEVLWECYVGNTASAVTARRAGFAYTGTAPALIVGRDGDHPVCWKGELTRTTDAAAADASWRALLG